MTEVMMLRRKPQHGLLMEHCPPPDVFKDIYELHQLFKCVVSDYPQIPSKGTPELRRCLIVEEYDELLEALAKGDLEKIADGIADCIVVLLGTAVSYGIPFNAVWREVHRTNMAKVGADGKPIFREDGKFLKPEGWQPPNIQAIISNAVHGYLRHQEAQKEAAEQARLSALAHEDQNE